MHSPIAVLLFSAAVAPLMVFAAQPSPGTNPATPDAATSPVRYESVFTGYRAYRDEKLAPWREVNDEVGRVGGQSGIFGGTGHTGHGNTQSVTNTPPPATTPQASPPMHGPGHQGMTK